jgi:hypothetical protein
MAKEFLTMAKPVIKSADELYEWQQAIRAATGRQDVADVIGAWMSGLPTESFATQLWEEWQAQTKSAPNMAWAWGASILSFLTLPATLLGTTAASLQYGGKIWTIEKQCPNGPPLSEALNILKDADRDLWGRATTTGELQRTATKAQANETGRQELGRDIIKGTGYVLGGLDDLTGGLVTVAKWGLLAWIAAKIYSATRKS